MRLLHTFNIVKVYFFSNCLTVRRNYCIVILNFFSMVHERSHFSLAAFIYKHWSYLKDCFRVEIVSRIGYRYGSVDFTGYDFKWRRIAGDSNTLCHLSHLLRRSTRNSCKSKDCDCQ